MKTISKLALAALITTGLAGTATVAPAFAEKKKEDDGGLKLTPAVLKPAQAAQTAIAAKDFATAETQLAAVDTAATSDDDKYIAAALRYDLEGQKLAAAQAANPNAPLDERVFARPLEVLIANPRTAPADKAKYAYRRGALAFNAKQWPVALQYFNQAKQLGYTDPNFALQMVKVKGESGDFAGFNADLNALVDQMAASGQKAPEDYYRYGIARANARKAVPETMAWLKKYIAAYPTTKNWRDVLITYGLQQQSVATLDNPQKIDLFRLMRATGALADQYDYEEYAQKVFDRGLPAEAQAVLNEGKASGKIPASSTSARSLLTVATTAAKSEGSLAPTEAKAKAAATGSLAASTADAYLSQANYTKAAELYRLALTKGGVNADEVNTRLGIALGRGGDKAGAAAAFAAVKGTPRADIAGLWATWLTTTA